LVQRENEAGFLSKRRPVRPTRGDFEGTGIYRSDQPMVSDFQGGPKSRDFAPTGSDRASLCLWLRPEYFSGLRGPRDCGRRYLLRFHLDRYTMTRGYRLEKEKRREILFTPAYVIYEGECEVAVCFKAKDAKRLVELLNRPAQE
jgi:hypothetical protein